jgi:hypothetical protein
MLVESFWQEYYTKHHTLKAVQASAALHRLQHMQSESDGDLMQPHLFDESPVEDDHLVSQVECLLLVVRHDDLHTTPHSTAQHSTALSPHRISRYQLLPDTT